MGFKRFNRNTFLIIISLILTSVLTGWALSSKQIHLSIILSAMLILLTFLLYRYFSGVTNEILFFFKAIKNEDSSLIFKKKTGSPIIDELHLHLQNLNDTYRNIKEENEVREKHFSIILENIPTGIFLISYTGHINHANTAALRLFGLPVINHIRAIKEIDHNLYILIKRLGNQQKKELFISGGKNKINKYIGLQATEMNMGGENIKVITIQDFSTEMERKEIEDWIRLIRILSHEIMNSLAPITSISNSLKEVWAGKAEKEKPLSEGEIKKTINGLDAIAEQSEGLTTFFESYKVLSRIPEPSKSDFYIKKMFERIETLITYDKELNKIPISFICHDPDLLLHADEQMITNVLINLIRNAAQALEKHENPVIQIQALKNQEGYLLIKVIDNGPGIPDDIADQIFLPFFTTRTKGSGVGLSYSRQVMNMNDGRIEFNSKPGRTGFHLVWNQAHINQDN